MGDKNYTVVHKSVTVRYSIGVEVVVTGRESWHGICCVLWSVGSESFRKDLFTLRTVCNHCDYVQVLSLSKTISRLKPELSYL